MSTVPEITTSIPPLFGNFNGQNLKLRQITVEEYDTMIQNGMLNNDDQVELLNGAIVEKMPKGTNHANYNDIIATLLIQRFGNAACVRNQNPIWLDDFSEPEPDIVLVEPPFQKYFKAHPTPKEIYFILEVSDSTPGYDRQTKGEAYARAGIRQYLVLNVAEKVLEDYREPGTDGFRSKQTYCAGQTFSLEAFPDISLSVNDFLPAETI